MSILAAFAVPHPPIIVSEIGKGEEHKIDSTITAYKEAMKLAAILHPDTLVISSPHADGYLDYLPLSPGDEASGDFGAFNAPEVHFHVKYDKELTQLISERAAQEGMPAGLQGTRHPELDHGTMIPLYFYRQFGSLDQVRIVRIGISGMSALVHYSLGQYVARAAEKLNRRVVYIASGDLSHKLTADGPYGFAPEGPVFDQKCMEYLGKGDLLSLLSMDSTLCSRAAECGLRSFWIMAGALDRKSIRPEVLSHEGPFGVGYGVVKIEVAGDDPKNNWGEQLIAKEAREREERKNREDAYVRLARYTIENFVKNRTVPALPDNLPPDMLSERHGAFVSLHLYGQLRGCIGTFAPTTENTAHEIQENAVAAATRDPRFPPVTPPELMDLVYSVDVLEEPEPIPDMTYLDPRIYGVIVKSASDERRGLLLPDLDGVDTPEQQVEIARQKGNIGKSEPVELWRFRVTRHK
jgi:AmmeMemoRadiSam system protein A/AmmeMemoRadiSam system protein B